MLSFVDDTAKRERPADLFFFASKLRMICSLPQYFRITMVFQTLHVIPISSQCLCLQTLRFNTDRCDGHGLETTSNPSSSMGAYFPTCGPQCSASRPPGSPFQEGLVATGLLGLTKHKQPKTMRAYFPYCPPCGPSGAMSACKRTYYGGEKWVSRFGELYNYMIIKHTPEGR